MGSLCIVGDVSLERCWQSDLSCRRASHFVMYSVLSITTRATPLSAVTIMQSLSFLRFSSAKCSALVMFVCIGLLVYVLRILLTS